jgi:hypothetical protein
MTITTKINNPFGIFSNVKSNKFHGVTGVNERGKGQEPLLIFDNMGNAVRAGFYVLRKQYNNLNIDQIANKYSRTDREGYKNYLIQELGKDFELNADDNNSLLRVGTAMMGFESGKKQNVLKDLNFSDKFMVEQIERSKQELEDSKYSQENSILKKRKPIKNQTNEMLNFKNMSPYKVDYTP